MKHLDEYGFNKKWLAKETQAAVYRRMIKQKSLSRGGDDYFLSHTADDVEFRGRLIGVILGLLAHNARVLSIAEGEGHLMGELIAQGIKDIEGVDICPELVTRGQLKGLKIQEADARSLPFKDNTFDALIINESIGAIGLSEALIEARRVLKPGGKIVITNYDYAEHEGEEVTSPVVKYRYILSDLIVKALEDKNFGQISVQSIPIHPAPDLSDQDDCVSDQMDILVAFKPDKGAAIY